MSYRIAVTFEFETDAPVTHRATVTATSAHTAASRAIREARRVLGRRKPTSIVLLIEAAA